MSLKKHQLFKVRYVLNHVPTKSQSVAVSPNDLIFEGNGFLHVQIKWNKSRIMDVLSVYNFEVDPGRSQMSRN